MGRNDPITVAAVDVDPEYVWVDPETGEQRLHTDLTFTPEDMERIRQGFACLRCWEIQRVNGVVSAFPEACSLCGYPMREQQREDFAREFRGEKWVGPTKTIEQIRVEDDERKAKAREAGIWTPPRSLDAA